MPVIAAHDDHGSAVVDDGFGRLVLDRVIAPPPSFTPDPTTAPAGPAGAPIPIASIPELHSFPGAPVSIYLDFDGHTEATWGSYTNVVTPIFDTDADNTTYSDAEQAIISEVWKRVSEDFAPFNIDVTTADPGDFSDGVGLRLSIGGDGSWTGGTYGGVAYIDSFTNSLPNTAYVFPTNLSNTARNIAEASSHEAGHAFGLEHQSTYDGGGMLTAEYNPGNAAWAPIMGVSYYSAQSLWHNGATPAGSTVLQDDLAVLTKTANVFGYRTDDHSDTFASATNVSTGSISETGIIEQSGDLDVFEFETFSSGTIQITAAGAEFSPNLDIILELYSSAEELLATDDPSGSLGASFNTTYAAGQYYLVVRSDDEYGELGQYSLTGMIPDNNPPVLATVGNQTVVHNQNSLDLTLSATDADGDSITYSAAAVTIDPLAGTAYDLQQDYGLVASISEFLNFRGLNEKYLQGANDTWYYILPAGELYQWGGSIAASTQIGTLDSTYYADLSLLYNATPQTLVAFSGTLNVSGTTLTIDPTAGFAGTFGVTITATDGTATDTETIEVAVTNQDPVLSTVANQTIAHNVDTLAITLSATDGDSDTLTYAATAGRADPIEAAAYQLDQTHDFFAGPSEFLDFRGLSEKYFRGANNEWFYILSDGSVYNWAGTVGASTLVGTLNNSYYLDLSTLYDVAEPSATAPVSVTVGVSGSTISLDPAASVTGEFTVTATATDGVVAASTTFTVTVTNTAPALTSIADQALSYATNTLALTLAATDAESDSITYSATSSETDVAATVSGTTLTLDPTPSFLGTATITVTADDGAAQDTTTFVLTVGNADPVLTAIADQTIPHTTATLDVTLAASDADGDTITYGATSSDTDVTAAVSGTTLTLDPIATFAGTATITVTADDGNTTVTETFILTVTNQAPVLTAIADQTLPHATDTLAVTLAATDGDGDTITYGATAGTVNAIEALAYQLDQANDFTAASSEHLNLRGLNEKYFLDGSADWYYILSTGAVYQWGGSIAGSTLLGTLNNSYYVDVTTLFDVAQPSATDPVNVSTSISGTTLTIDPDISVTGEFTVTVTADDGIEQGTTSFTVTVGNSAPALTAIADQQHSYSTNTLDITLSATDADSDTLTYSATSSDTDVTASVTGTTLTLDPAGSFLGDATITVTVDDGAAQDTETFVISVTNSTPVLTSTADQSMSHATATMDITLAATDPDSDTITFGATSSETDVTASVSGTTLTLDPTATFVGTATITVTAADAINTATDTFTLTVTNQAPVLAAIADQTITHNLNTVDITLAATDGDGDTITYSATAGTVNAVAALAYSLDQTHDFTAASSEFLNLRGLNEKYLNDANGDWYYILSTGEIFQWGGTVATSTSLGTLNNSYYLDLTTLFDVAQPAATEPVDVTPSVSGTTLTLDPAVTFAGAFTVTVVADDGIAQDTTTFDATVTNTAPVLTAIADQTMSHTTATLDVTLAATDGDADTVTFSATSSDTDVTASVSGTTLTLDPAASFLGTATITVTVDDGESQDTDTFVLTVTNAAPVVTTITNQSISHSVPTLDITLAATDADSDTVTFSATSSDTDVAATVSGTTLTLDPTASFLGTATITVTATDTISPSTTTFDITVTNTTPAITPIADDSILHTVPTLDVTLAATDADSDTFTFSATSSETDVTASVSGTTLTLDPAATFSGTADITVTADDGIGTSTDTFVLTVTNQVPAITDITDQSMSHAVPTLDITLAATDGDADTLTYSATSSDTDVTASVSGTTLTLDPTASFVGTATITVTVDDGPGQDTDTFVLTVTNGAPAITTITNQSISHSVPTLDITLAATDVDTDTVTFSAASSDTDVAATVSGTTLTLDPAPSFLGTATITVTATDTISPSTTTFDITVTNTTPALTATSDQTIPHTTATLDITLTATDADTDTITLGATSSDTDVAATISGTTLTLDPASTFVGTATITVTAGDGNTTATDIFDLTVTNQAPVFTTVSDQTIAHNVNTLDITLAATDGDGDTVTYAATAAQIDPIADLAYQLDQTHDFFAAPSEDYDLLGAQEKYFLGDGGLFFFVLPTGAVYQFVGSIGGSTLLGTLDSSYHTDLTNLFDVVQPTPASVNVTVNLTGGALTLDPAADFVGTFTVTATATDTLATTTMLFDVTVTNNAPVVGTIADQTHSYATNTLDITLSPSDADGDTLTLSVVSSDTDVTASISGTTLTLDPAGSFLGDATITVTADDGAAQGTESFVISVTNSTPALTPIADQSISHAIATLDITLAATDDDSDTITYGATSSDTDVTASVSGTTLTLDPSANFVGTSTITVTAADAANTGTETFTLTVTNQAPMLSTISNQTMTHNLNTLDITLAASDGDSDTITYSATAGGINALAALAYQLDQTHDFMAASSESLNLRGVNEKYFHDANEDWFYILPTGAVYQWGGTIASSTLLGTLDGTYYADLTTLFDVVQPTATDPVDVTPTVSGTTLTLDPAVTYTGEFTVTVVADDGIEQDTTTFTVTVTNAAPSMTAIADQPHSYATNTLDVALAATDGDGDTLTYSATSSETDVTATVSGTTLTLDPTPSFLGDATITVTVDDGAAQDSTAFVLSVTNSTPDLTTIANQTIPHTTATLDITITATDADSDTITYGATSSETDVTASLSGTTLTLDPIATFAGTATITVTAGDGNTTDTETFTLTVTNQAPSLTAITDQTMSHSTNTLDVTLAASDGDGDTITYTATAGAVNALAALAYQLDQTHDFTAAGSESLNLRGLNEKYFLDSSADWYYILPTGAVYQWGGTIASSTLLGTLDGTYYADLTTLFDVAQPTATDPVSVTTAISGTTLTLDPDISVAGEFTVTVTADDGIEQDTTSFTVTVNNTAPALTAVTDQSISHSVATLDLTLAATDAEGDTITYSATSSETDVTASVSGTTLTLDPTASFLGTATITVTADDGAAQDTTTFTLTVTNTAPALTAITDQSMVTTDTLDLTLTATDADTDTISFSATAVGIDPVNQQAYTLDQTHNFYAASSEYLDLRGLSEKYFLGGASEWFYILPTGAVYQWGGTIGSSTLLDTLDASYYADLTTLYDVVLTQTSVNPSLTFTGSVMTIDPEAAYTGTMSITVTASDGTDSSTQSFTLTVTASSPPASGLPLDVLVALPGNRPDDAGVGPGVSADPMSSGQPAIPWGADRTNYDPVDDVFRTLEEERLMQQPVFVPLGEQLSELDRALADWS